MNSGQGIDVINLEGEPIFYSDHIKKLQKAIDDTFRSMHGFGFLDLRKAIWRSEKGKTGWSINRSNRLLEGALNIPSTI
jgi:hypothetical protein